MIKYLLVIFGFIGGIFFLPHSIFAQSNPNKTSQQSKPCDSLKSITIHQEIEFNVSPRKLYQALLDGKQFSAFSADDGFPPMSAKIDSTVGGTFSFFGGHIIGLIVELVSDQRIVEAWRVVDWPAGIYSIARFEFFSIGPGTRLVFDHTGFPEGLKDHLALGWQQHYWDPLRKYFQK